jgi:hypothetical protein
LRLGVAQGRSQGGKKRAGHELTACPTEAFGARI